MEDFKCLTENKSNMYFAFYEYIYCAIIKWKFRL